MSELILHSYRRCPFAIRVRMTLEEKNLPYIVKEESLREPSADLLRLHPEGKVPLLIHNGVAIHESSVITEYLDELFPSPSLRPQDALGRAQLRLWTHWVDQIFKPDLDRFKYKFESISPEEQAAVTQKIKTHLAKLEDALTRAPYLLGEQFTLADIHVFPFYRQLTKARPGFSPQIYAPHTQAWLEKNIARPSFAQVMEKQKAPAI